MKELNQADRSRDRQRLFEMPSGRGQGPGVIRQACLLFKTEITLHLLKHIFKLYILCQYTKSKKFKVEKCVC